MNLFWAHVRRWAHCLVHTHRMVSIYNSDGTHEELHSLQCECGREFWSRRR